MTSVSSVLLKFAPLQSSVDISFWAELSRRKLEQYKLSEEAVAGYGVCCVCRGPNLSSAVAFDRTSFDAHHQHQGFFKIPGEIYIVNSIENFKAFDRRAAVEKSVDAIKKTIEEGVLYEEGSNAFLLQRFVLLTYADLKNHEFIYWFCFPAITPSAPYRTDSVSTLSAALDEADEICRALDRWLQGSNGFCRPVFKCKQRLSTDDETDCFRHVLSPDSMNESDAMLCVLDPCHLAQHPSWLLRNILAFVASRTALDPLTIACCRQRNAKISALHSPVFKVPVMKEDIHSMQFVPGWESNSANKAAPRRVSLRSHFDPKQLAEEAMGLNIRLMLWRAAPGLQLDAFLNTRCLLIGMGTLGCCVARSLLGWGIKHLSLVDSSRVSFSNPVRQCLYEFEDCLEQGKFKAEAAAEHLKSIHPGVHVESHVFEVPMPGHPPDTEQDCTTTHQTVDELHALVERHDVVFLLTDNRESRWLPSVVGAALGKIVICVALGYDSYLIMRHGMHLTETEGLPLPPPLGCYFCNDIQAPTGTFGLALDQQCTVARPGLAPIASALAVELLVSVLHHPMKNAAPHGMPDEMADEGSSSVAQGSVMGGVPHMMKGSVFHFSNSCIEGPAFHQCTACSEIVRSAYLQDRWNFVRSALTDESYLQDLTGLTELLKQAEELTLNEYSNDDCSDFEIL